MFKLTPCTVQLSAQISFAAQRAWPCGSCTRNALTSCTNESPHLWIEKKGELPCLGCGWQGGTTLSKLAHLKVCPSIDSLLWYSLVTAELSSVPFPRVTQQRTSHPNSWQEQQCWEEWKCQRRMRIPVELPWISSSWASVVWKLQGSMWEKEGSAQANPNNVAVLELIEPTV